MVAVNVCLDKAGASADSGSGHVGPGSEISPFHTQIDGDLTIVLGKGEAAGRSQPRWIARG